MTLEFGHVRLQKPDPKILKFIKQITNALLWGFVLAMFMYIGVPQIIKTLPIILRFIQKENTNTILKDFVFQCLCTYIR